VPQTGHFVYPSPTDHKQIGGSRFSHPTSTSFLPPPTDIISVRVLTVSVGLVLVGATDFIFGLSPGETVTSTVHLIDVRTTR
ncbi:hypothetical protein, partial [Gordonia sp. i37]|uniref:hypothetical protein n=1 Tax=Gordonia sp. i37 TaxID=1961707 RepID=UPI001C0E7F60